MEPELETFDGPLPLFPLPNVVLFPHMVLPLHIFEPRYRKMVEDVMNGHALVGMVKLEPELPLDDDGDPAIRQIGCMGKITDLTPLTDGRYNLKLLGIRKFEILGEVKKKPYRTARVRWLVDGNESGQGPAAEAALRRNFEILARLARELEGPPLTRKSLEGDLPFPGIVHAQILASRLVPDALQDLLELPDALLRADRLTQILRERLSHRARLERWKGFAPDDPAVN